MYQKRYFSVFILCLIFNLWINTSCTHNVDKEKFKNVILEIHKCEAWNELKFKGTNKKFEENCKKNAMTKLNISNEEMTDIMKYYDENPEEFEHLYDTLITKIETEYKQ